MNDKILIVDDEKEIADLVEVYLLNENYVVHKFYCALKALDFIESDKGNELDLAVLDIMMPGLSGLELCQKIREKHTYPVIMLTARDSETDKITGLTLGADDYVAKPFLPLELLARVKAQLRRYKRYSLQSPQNAQNTQSLQNKGAGEKVIFYKGLEIDVGSHEVTKGDEPISLTPTEFAILRILCERGGGVVSSEELFKEIWGEEYYSKNNNTITVHIRNLREKLGDVTDKPKYIKTVWGVGYKCV